MRAATATRRLISGFHEAGDAPEPAPRPSRRAHPRTAGGRCLLVPGPFRIAQVATSVTQRVTSILRSSASYGTSPAQIAAPIMKYRSEIDGLRALAVLPVVFFHAGLTAFSGGYVGVDVFFVISGYLITTIIREQLRLKTFTIRGFYERRARRILPMMFVVCAACIPFAWAWMLPGELQEFGQSLIATTTFASNILFWSQSGYFDGAAELRPLLHTWSLSVEEQFYLFFPLLLLLLHKFHPGRQFAIVLLITVASFTLSIYGAYSRPSANFYLIPTRAWELGIGSLLALRENEKTNVVRRGNEGLAALGLALIVLPIFLFDESTPFPSQYALAPVLGTALVIGWAAPSTIVGRILSHPWLTGIGLISYSLYLWHQPVFAFLKLRSLTPPSSGEMAAAILISFALAVTSWKLIETPFRSRERIQNKTVWRFAAVCSAVLLSIGVVGHATAGLRDVSKERAALSGLGERFRVNHGLHQDCEGEFTTQGECRTGNAPTIMVWGDSYAMHLVAGIVADMPEVSLVQHTKSVCGPILGLAPMTPKYRRDWALGCLDFNRKVMQWLSENRSVQVAILSSPFAQYLDPESEYLTDAGIGAVDISVLTEAFSKTLTRIEAMGVVPIVVSPPPRGPFDVGRCLVSAVRIGADFTGCDFQRRDSELQQAGAIAFLKKLDVNYQVVWLADRMCDSKTCSAARGHTMLYRDVGHLSYEGSEYLGKELKVFSSAIERAGSPMKSR